MGDLSDALDKAEAAVTAAERNTDVLEVARAAMELAKLSVQQPQHQGCQHQAPKPEFDSKKWLTIGGLAIGGGCVACVLAIAFAMFVVAVAIGGICATACLIVLRDMWRSSRKG